MAELDAEMLGKFAPRVGQAQNIWLATVREDGRPHLVPIWFVWHDGKVWISTGRNSQKRKNIEHNPNVCVSLEDGTDPIVLEGTAQVYDDEAVRDTLAPHFFAKYEWDMHIAPLWYSTPFYAILRAVPPLFG